MVQKSKYALPSYSFRHKIPLRLNILSVPRKDHGVSEGMPGMTENGVRIRAISGTLPNANTDIALPNARRLLMLRNNYKDVFDKKRLTKIKKTIEKSNGTYYTKLANGQIDIKKLDSSTRIGRKTGWSDNDWRKHMDYISKIANPKKPLPEPVVVRKTVPLSRIMPRIIELSQPPEMKLYRRMSQEPWYKDPDKVPKSALTYQITPRMVALATPRVVAAAE